MGELSTEVAKYWTQLRIGRQGVEESAIERVESRFRTRLSPAFRELYLAADGMDVGVMDPHLFRFWPLHEVISATSYLEKHALPVHDGFLIFADWSIDAHAYGLEIAGASSDRIAIIGGRLPVEIVASSFSEFLDNYLRHRERLL